MQLLLTTKRHFTIALWIPVRLSTATPDISEGMQRSIMRRVNERLKLMEDTLSAY
jgi:hypothetical protein